jgi:hypothetical protein
VRDVQSIPLLKQGGSMQARYMVWTGHFLALVLMAFGLWWLIGHLSGLPGHKLVAALAALTGFVFNHIRWSGMGKTVNAQEVFEKINLLVVANYVVLLLVLALVDL